MHATDEEKLLFWAARAHELIDKAVDACKDGSLYNSVYLERVDTLCQAMGHLAIAIGSIAKTEVQKNAWVRKPSE